jgi:hypothetical protein
VFAARYELNSYIVFRKRLVSKRLNMVKLPLWLINQPLRQSIRWWTASRSSCFIPMDIASGTHWIEGCVGPRASLEISLAGFEPRLFNPQPVAISTLIQTIGPLTTL